MRGRPRRHLRRMGHREHLHPRGEAGEALADRIGDRAADARVDLVEHQRRSRAAIRQHDLQRQQKSRQLAARGDLGQGSRARSRVGLDPELHPVDPFRPARFRIAGDGGMEMRALQF